MLSVYWKISPRQYLQKILIMAEFGLNLDLQNDIKKIAVALDPTEYVLNRAAMIGADLLVTHSHPDIPRSALHQQRTGRQPENSAGQRDINVLNAH